MRRFLGVCFFIAIAMGPCSIALVNQATAADHLNAAIQAMPENSWMTVPNSKLHGNPVEALDSEFPGIWQGNAREADGRFAWSGGALDSKRDRLVIWGGGHADYYGNELYAFNLQDFTWDRLTDPSPVLSNPDQCTDILTDGNPNSRHTYYNLDYIPEVDSMFSSPAGSTACNSGGLDRNTWLFDFEANEAANDSSLRVGWINQGQPARNPDGSLVDRDSGVGRPITGELPTASAYDPNSGIVYSISNSGLYDYNVENNFWRRINPTQIGAGGGGISTDTGIVIDPKRNKIVVIGSGRVLVYDLDNENGMQYQQQVWATTNGEFNDGAYRPGVNYDPVADRIVVWDGGAVRALNMDTREWEALASTPQLPADDGTYGRFRYSPTQNAYIAINGGNKDVLIYKLQNIPEPTGVALLLTAIPFMTTRRRRRQN